MYHHPQWLVKGYLDGGRSRTNPEADLDRARRRGNQKLAKIAQVLVKCGAYGQMRGSLRPALRSSAGWGRR